MCVYVCVFGSMNVLHLCWVEFWELNMLFGSLVELLACCIYFLVFLPPWKTPFLQARQLFDRSLINSFLSSFSLSFLDRSLTDSRSIEEFSCALCLLDSISIASRYIEVLWFLLNRISTASQSIEISVLLLDTFSTASSIYETNFYALCLLDRFSIHWDILFSVNRSSVAPR